MESEQLYHRGYCRNSYNSIASASSDEELLDGAGVIMDFHTTEDDNLLDGDAASPGKEYRKYRTSDTSLTFIIFRIWWAPTCSIHAFPEFRESFSLHRIFRGKKIWVKNFLLVRWCKYVAIPHILSNIIFVTPHRQPEFTRLITMMIYEFFTFYIFHHLYILPVFLPSRFDSVFPLSLLAMSLFKTRIWLVVC